LRLIAEQGAIPFDQLARFAGCEESQAARVAVHLFKAGFADYGRFLYDEPPLHIAARAPEARWLCARSVVREQGKRGHRPNAVVEIGRERHALLTCLRVQPQERTRAIVETHMARYDAVIAFAKPAPRRLLERLATENHWPKLVVRAVPEPPQSGS